MQANSANTGSCLSLELVAVKNKSCFFFFPLHQKKSNVSKLDGKVISDILNKGIDFCFSFPVVLS